MAKDKLKSKRWSSNAKEKRNKEREKMLNNLLNIQVEIVRLGDIKERQEKLASLRKELLEIALRHDHKEFEKELDNLCQARIELTKSELELEDLQSQQQEAQILSPTNDSFNSSNS